MDQLSCENDRTGGGRRQDATLTPALRSEGPERLGSSAGKRVESRVGGLEYSKVYACWGKGDWPAEVDWCETAWREGKGRPARGSSHMTVQQSSRQ